MSAETVEHLRWTEIDTAGPWQSALLPVAGYPMQESQAHAYELFFGALTDVLTRTHGLQHQVFLQVWKLGSETGIPALQAHRRAWHSQLGLGIWPNRPPQGWTEERMVDAAAAVYRGDEPELPSYPLLRLRATPEETATAARTLRRFGILVQTFSRSNPAQSDVLFREALVPRIDQARFQSEDFYLPLLDRKSVAAISPAETGRLLCDTELYLRDSPEDKGILVVSRFPLIPLFQSVSDLLKHSLLED